MNLFRVMEISGSALLAERMRAEVVSANMANAETTRHRGRRAVSADACRLRSAASGAAASSA